MFLYLIPLFITVIIEDSLALIVSGDKKFVLIVTLANIITNPAANFVANKYAHIFWGGTFSIMLIVFATIIAEWLIYLAVYRKRPWFLLSFSMTANGLSWLFGLMLF